MATPHHCRKPALLPPCCSPQANIEDGSLQGVLTELVEESMVRDGLTPEVSSAAGRISSRACARVLASLLQSTYRSCSWRQRASYIRTHNPSTDSAWPWPLATYADWPPTSSLSCTLAPTTTRP